MKKIGSLLMVLLMGITLIAGCKKDDDTSCGDMTLDDLNAMLNDKVNMNMNLANTVAIIPFNHINGPRNEWKFYALVNFQYKENTYVKYQVTFLSCTCRAARVNYWSTAYVELTTPKYAKNARVQKLSFDLDGTGHYTAGFWGDSNPIMDEATGTQIIATYADYIDARKISATIDGIKYTLNYDENDIVTSLQNGSLIYEVNDNKVDVGPQYIIEYKNDVATKVKNGNTKYDVVDNEVTINDVTYTLVVDTDEQSETFNKVLSVSDGVHSIDVTDDKFFVLKEYTLTYDNPIYVGDVTSLKEGTNTYNVTEGKVTINNNTYELEKDEDEDSPTYGVYTNLKKGQSTYSIVDNEVTIDDVAYTLSYETFEYGNNDIVKSLTDGTNTIDVKIDYKGLFKDLDEDGHVDGNYYPTIKHEFIEDLLLNKTKTQIDAYNTMDDMVGTDSGSMSEELFDSFTGASVSTNNILRILHALFEYHENTWWKDTTK